MLALLLAVAAAREMPPSAGDLRPMGPISQEVAQSYQDLDAVQDHILAAQAEESKEMDRILGPAPPHPSSFLETGTSSDDDPASPVIDFSDLDNIQSKLKKLHTKMNGELTNLKKITNSDEEFEKKAELAAKQAKEAAEDGASSGTDSEPIADAPLSEFGEPSSFLETGEMSKSEMESRKLMGMMFKLNQMKSMFSPYESGLQDVKDPEGIFAHEQLKKLNGVNTNVVQLMMNMVNAIKKKDPVEEKVQMDALKKGMAAVKLQMSQQKDEILAHRANLPKAPLAKRLGAAIHMAMDPLREHFETLMKNDPNVSRDYDVPLALEKLADLKKNAVRSSEAIGLAQEKLSESHSEEESKQIQRELAEELKASKENMRLGWAQVQALSQAMNLMPRKGMKPSPYTDFTQRFRARMAKAIMTRPKLQQSKLVMQGLSHTAAIDGLAKGYDQIVKLLPQVVDKAPDELAKKKGVQALRVLLGTVQQQADAHGAALQHLGQIFDALNDVPAHGHGAEPWSLVQGEKYPQRDVTLPALPQKSAEANDAAEKQYEKIQKELMQMQNHLQTQVSSLKEQAQQQANKQVQDLDALMTPHDTMRSMPVASIMSALETKANATVAKEVPPRAFRGAESATA